MYCFGGGHCNKKFPNLKSINSSLISPTTGDTPIISTSFHSNLLSVITLFYKGEEIILPLFKPAN